MRNPLPARDGYGNRQYPADPPIGPTPQYSATTPPTPSEVTNRDEEHMRQMWTEEGRAAMFIAAERRGIYLKPDTDLRTLYLTGTETSLEGGGSYRLEYNIDEHFYIIAVVAETRAVLFDDGVSSQPENPLKYVRVKVESQDERLTDGYMPLSLMAGNGEHPHYLGVVWPYWLPANQGIGFDIQIAAGITSMAQLDICLLGKRVPRGSVLRNPPSR